MLDTVTRDIPLNASVEHFEDIKAVVYSYEDDHRICAKAYLGKSNKPKFLYCYDSVETREAHIRSWVAGLSNLHQEKKQFIAKRKSFVHTLKIGDILKCSFGDALDYYEVIALKGKTMVVVRRLLSKVTDDAPLTCNMVYRLPLKGAYRGDPITKKVFPENSIELGTGMYAEPWNGKKTPHYYC